ncbi:MULTISPECIES: hypothetical protein [Chelatococcus]|uniref:Uncharacterized protein n=1 Tax=Chelatococcus caeni TaxID=1348468 RepID=A0A840BRL6_9HYPH|nr:MULTISPECIES: hypothetical protein [Chelatococcus]MBB4016081.1 hypothetical protein [Chelatococcus caeni]
MTRLAHSFIVFRRRAPAGWKALYGPESETRHRPVTFRWQQSAKMRMMERSIRKRETRLSDGNTQ